MLSLHFMVKAGKGVPAIINETEGRLVVRAIPQLSGKHIDVIKSIFYLARNFGGGNGFEGSNHNGFIKRAMNSCNVPKACRGKSAYMAVRVAKEN